MLKKNRYLSEYFSNVAFFISFINIVECLKATFLTRMDSARNSVVVFTVRLPAFSEKVPKPSRHTWLLLSNSDLMACSKTFAAISNSKLFILQWCDAALANSVIKYPVFSFLLLRPLLLFREAKVMLPGLIEFY